MIDFKLSKRNFTHFKPSVRALLPKMPTLLAAVVAEVDAAVAGAAGAEAAVDKVAVAAVALVTSANLARLPLFLLMAASTSGVPGLKRTPRIGVFGKRRSFLLSVTILLRAMMPGAPIAPRKSLILNSSPILIHRTNTVLRVRICPSPAWTSCCLSSSTLLCWILGRMLM